MNIFLHCGNLVHLFSFYVLIYDILKKQHCHGISGKTQILYLIVFLTRYTDLATNFISFYNTSMKCAFIFLTFVLICLIHAKRAKTYKEEYDTFYILPLVILGGFLALFFNYYSFKGIWIWSTDEYISTTQEILWAFSIYLEVVAILPQYYMFKKSGKGKRLLPYVAALCTYRTFYIANWIYRYLVENHYDTISFCSGIVQTLILIVMLVEISVHKEKSPKWQEITQVFAIEASKDQENRQNALFAVDIEHQSNGNDEQLLLSK